MDNGGMVAVVQGLRDSGLTVTLLDGGKQYTLTPETAPHPVSPRRPPENSSQPCTSVERARTNHRENGVQATDGRYASTYKMMHCNYIPTSPPQDVTEFPPQRAEVRYGHGNFVVGGLGSGPNNPQAVKTDRYRGAMCWPDKGSVCASRPSVQPDAFANSLRRYPLSGNISPERSSEIVERLINFTQAKNQSRNQNRGPISPPRHSVDSTSSKQTYLLDQRSYKNSELKSNYIPDITGRRIRADSSPGREGYRSVSEQGNEGARGRYFYRTNDVRCIRDAARQIREGMRQAEMPSNNQNFTSPLTKERYDKYQRILDQSSNNSVSMEIQASAQMESKEILTLPRIVPMQRTVATPLTPVISTETISNDDLSPHGSPWDLRRKSSCKSIQVMLDSPEVNGKTLSSVQLHKIYFKNRRMKSRSEEELSIDKKNMKHEILKLLHDLNMNDKTTNRCKCTASRRLRVCQECKQNILDQSDDPKLDGTISDHFQSLTRNETNKQLKHMVKKCLKMKARELGEKGINKDQLMHVLLNKLKIIANSVVNNKRHSLNNDMDEFDKISNEIEMEKNSDVSINKFGKRKKWSRQTSYVCCNKDDRQEKHYSNQHWSSNSIIMTHKELRNLIDLDLLAFTEKYRVNISTEDLNKLRDELFDLLAIDYKNISFNRNDIRKNIISVLQNRGFSELQVLYLTNVLTEHWSQECLANVNTKSYTKTPVNVKSDTFIIFPNLTNNAPRYRQSTDDSVKEAECSINEVSQRDIDVNVDTYVKQLSKEINDWLMNLQIPQARDAALRESIIKDLANDIVDRHKYLELNPSNEISNASELENLKYQIFKWIYKLVGDVDMTPVEHADDLMQRIKRIPVPNFSKQHRNINVDKKPNDGEPGGLVPKVNLLEPSNEGATSTKRLSTPTNLCCKRPTCKRNREALSKSSSARFSSLRDPDGAKESSPSTRRMSSPGKLFSKNPSQLQVTSKDNAANSNQYPRSVGTSDGVPRDQNGNFTGGIGIKDDDDDVKIDSTQQRSIPTAQANTDGDALDKLNAEYDKYLKEWLQSLPIPVSRPEDERHAEQARLGIYHNIWGTIVKLSKDPLVVNNRFFYEDMLDDEIEQQLNTLPQSPELKSKKHLLKVNLIEKTSDINQQVKAHIRETYKQQLVDSVRRNLPTGNIAENQDPNRLKLYEELQVLLLVEDFILFTRYQNEDKVKAEAYRRKLIKQAEAYVDELKAHHGKDLMNINKQLYVNDMLNTLKEVPLPNDETIEREADEIQWGLEVEKWFTDLPLIPNDVYTEQLQRRRIRNILAKKLLEMEKGADSTDYALRNEVSQFIGGLALEKGEDRKINFMVDDLVKRLKNRPKTVGNDSRTVGFHEPHYEEFSRDMPVCSSYIENPNGNNVRLKRSGFSNQSIQVAGPSNRSYNEPFYSIPKSIDDVLPEPCCDPDASFQNPPSYNEFEGHRPVSSSLENNRPISSSYLVNGPVNSSHEEPQDQDWFSLHNSHDLEVSARDKQPSYRYNQSSSPRHSRQDYGQEEFVEVEPQGYMERVPAKYTIPQRPNMSLPYRRPSPRMVYERRSLPAWSRHHNDRRMAQPFVDQQIPGYEAPPQSSPKRHENFRVNESMRSDHAASPPYQRRGLVDYDDTEMEQHSPLNINRSGLFYKSTDQEGIRHTIDRNKSIAADLGRSTTEYRPGHQPAMFLPHEYTPKGPKGGFVIPEEGTGKRYIEFEDTDGEEEENEIRCRCIEKMWKSKRRPRYCPLEPYDYPMCMSAPYFYPYFY